jgi:phosphoglycerol transferase MdoB-like AlkP superfamily enzyme
MGVRFDIVISGYILFFPAIILFALTPFKAKVKGLINGIRIFIFIIFSIAFSINAIDIPYFNQFFSRLTVGGFAWLGYSPLFVIKMILEEPTYWLISIPLGLLIFAFYIVLKRIFNTYIATKSNIGNPILYIISALLLAGFIFLGVRGRIEKKSPIRVGTAFFSNDQFLNKLGLNPSFTLIRSYLNTLKEENQRIHLIDDQLALQNVKKYLDIVSDSASISRFVSGDSSSIKPNIVVIIMESMAADKMTRFGNPNNLTPFLDSLYRQGYGFDNFYSAGTHTFNGIFSTLFSFPAVFHKHPMMSVNIKEYHSMSYVLKQKDYQNIFFIPHDGQFDNVSGFLKANHFDEVVDQSNYPSEKVLSTLGVPDDYMFEFAIPKLNNLANQNKAFFAAFMTASDHGPYIVPDYFTPHNSEIRKQTVEYADWALSKFIKMASQQDWFDNTIFVFVADHGAVINPTFEMPISYNHIPFLIYAPKLLKKSEIIKSFGGQIDIFPTIMGIIAMSYTNEAMGVDLLKEPRPAMYFCNDNYLGVINDSLFLIIKDDKKRLFDYRSSNTQDLSKQYPAELNKMEKYGKSNLQAADFFMNR